MSSEDQDVARPKIGDNAPLRPSPDQVAEWLKAEYGDLVHDVDGLLAEARALPPTVTCEDDVKQYGELVKKLRDVKKRIDKHHDDEKAPYLRSGQMVDQFFFAQESRVEKRNKTDKAGTIDVLVARVDVYNQERLAQERARRQEEERKAREEAARLEEERREQDRLAREAEQKAARARNADNIAAAEAEAARRRQEADRLAAQESAARAAVRETSAAAAAKPADMVRERHDGGVLNSMKQVPYAEVTDRYKLDWLKLAAHFKDEHVLQALKAWARTVSYRVPMEGAIVEMRDATDLR